MTSLRTPDDAFSNLPGYDFEPNYVEVDEGVRMHYLDEGPADASPVLLLHGEPSWSYLYRHMVGPIVAAGHRVVAPDLIGFGRSDKLAERTDYTYSKHVEWVRRLLESLDLQNITLFCQDWGGLIGLRLIASTESERFSRVVAANTFLPSGREPMPKAFFDWQQFSQTVDVFPTGGVIQKATVSTLSPEVIAAYDAPFPDERYKEGARQFPLLVPSDPEDPEAKINQGAWMKLMQFKKPFLTLFSDQDPITRGGDTFLQQLIPGAKGQAHTTIRDAGHFLQEDKGGELAAHVVEFIKKNG